MVKLRYYGGPRLSAATLSKASLNCERYTSCHNMNEKEHSLCQKTFWLSLPRPNG